MADFRVPYGFALGRFANFQAKTEGLFAESDATPDVTIGSLFYSNNTSNTTITAFDITDPANPTGTQEGKVIHVVFLDSSTRLANSGRLFLASSDGLQGAQNAITLVGHNSAWYELSRSVNDTGFVSVNSSTIATNGMLNARQKKVVIATAAASSALTIRGAQNGEQGQQIFLYAQNSAVLVTVNSAAADTFVLSSSLGATTLTLNGSGVMGFLRIGNRWFENRESSTTAAT